MNKAVVTIASGAYFERMAALTHPTIQAYAEKISADFLVWSDISGYTIPEYKKMEVRELLDRYDRVLYIDTDVIVRDDSPDVFAIVPYDHLGMLEESRYYDRRIGVLRFMEHVGFDSTLWDGKYYNAGIFVCSRAHRELFVRPTVEWDHFRDQTYFNTLICDRKAKVFSLPYRFNRVLALDRFYGEDRLDAYFLHYAGVRRVLSEQETLDLIASDLEAWRQAKPGYRFRHNLAILVEGGLGEQIVAEPVVRYARDVLCQGDNLIVVSAFPEVFAHLELPIFSALDRVPSLGKYKQCCTWAKTATAADEAALVRHQVHGVSLASLAALGIELPLAAKRPQLPVSPAALKSVAEKVRPHKIESLVLLHPGRGLAADTFPPDVWSSYAKVLSAHGFTVAVIGTRQNAPCGVVEFDRSPYVDVVDKLSLEELIALVSRARVLISNDSALVQIAGAFDCWIGLIATARHPDYVLPWRNGPQSWRASNLERAGMYADYFDKPTGGDRRRLAVVNEARLRECLPEPAAILKFVRSTVVIDA